MADEKECMESGPRQRDKQQISVPFLWEERPGTPKKEWISKPAPGIPVPSPARLVVSVPFHWEEKPGKPLQLSQTLPDPLPLHALPGLNPFIDEEEGVIATSGFQVLAADMNDDAFGPAHHVTEDGSFADANGSPERSREHGSNRQENWYSVSETDCDNSSHGSATQNTSFDGSVVGFLFPLSSPDAGFLNKIRGQDRALIPTTASLVLQPTDCSHNHSVMPRRTLTLGELIMLSRKLSYKMKPADVKKSSHLTVLIKKSLLMCLPFSASSDKKKVFISDR